MGGLSLSASNAILGAGGLGRFPEYDFTLPTMGSTFDNSMSLINDYEMGRTTGKDEPLQLQPEFDILNWVNDLGGPTEEDTSAAA